jgi:hypothetical protein
MTQISGVNCGTAGKNFRIIPHLFKVLLELSSTLAGSRLLCELRPLASVRYAH